ncbi:MAG: shikimate kinase [Bryobacterales bacterium]|nr:shikimate kinase [Bryobacterales bacterium]
MRVAIVGNSGSGKSTLARQMAEAHAMPSLDLDSIAWQPGVSPPTLRDAADAANDVRAFCQAHESWVVEGCYASLVEAALAYSPLLVFLEPGVDTCLAHCRARPWEPHKYASPEQQEANLSFLLEWVRGYYTRTGDLSLAGHQALFGAYPGRKVLAVSAGGLVP